MENSFEHTKIHNVILNLILKNFKKIVETLLENLLKDVGISQEQFLKAAKFGLGSEHKKYFEQLIACDNYIYFKSLMVKRNLQIQEESYKLMYDDKVDGGNTSKPGNAKIKEQLMSKGDFLKKSEEKQYEAALQMSLILEQEKKKMQEIEDEEYQLALALSASGGQEEQEISLFDPSSLIKRGKDSPVKPKQNNIGKPINIQQTQPQKQNITNIEHKEPSKPISSNNSHMLKSKPSVPIVTSVKKEFDFSHLESQNKEQISGSKEAEKPVFFDFPNETISVTEKVVHDNQKENQVEHQAQVISNHNPDLMSFDEKPIQQDNNASIMHQTENTVPVIVNSIPVIKQSKIDKKTSDLISFDEPSTTPKGNKGHISTSVIQKENNPMDPFTPIEKHQQKITPNKVFDLTNTTIQNPNPLSDSVVPNSNNKVSLGQVKLKKQPIHQEPVKIDPFEKIQKLAGISQKQEEEKSSMNETDINKLYEEIQKEKAEKLKEYRSMVIEKKKDKREEKKVEEEKKDEKELINDSKLSDTVKKRLEMRKNLAEKLAHLGQSKK